MAAPGNTKEQGAPLWGQVVNPPRLPGIGAAVSNCLGACTWWWWWWRWSRQSSVLQFCGGNRLRRKRQDFWLHTPAAALCGPQTQVWSPTGKHQLALALV